jgi:hypothetical protein
VDGGIVFAEFRIAPQDRARFARWHSQEHIGERLEAGVTSAARYVAMGDELHFCAIYRASSAGVFATDAYAALAERASPLTREISAGVQGTRCLGDVVAEAGRGRGGLLTRLRLGDWTEAEAKALALGADVSGELSRLIIIRPRRDAPNVSDPSWIVMLEGAGTPAGLRREAAAVARQAGLSPEPLELFVLEHAIA